MNELTGKGMYLWIINDNDDPTEIAAACLAAGFSHVAIKIADAGYPYNVKYDDSGLMTDKVPALVEELHALGIQAWGWQFVYGNLPDAEASIAITRVQTLGLDGFIVNAETDYKGKNAAAVRYMDQIRNAFGGMIPIALSSFRFPQYHPEFPWQEFLSRVDINMPQVYWILAHNPGDQLARCLAEFALDKYPQVPIFPTGAAFSEKSWRASAAEVQEFMEKAKSLGLPGCNFWRYHEAMERYPDLHDVISGFDWPGDGYEEGDGIPDMVWNGKYKIVMIGSLFIHHGPGVLYSNTGDAAEQGQVFITDKRSGNNWYDIGEDEWISGNTKWTEITKYLEPVEHENPEPDPDPQPSLEEQVAKNSRIIANLLRKFPELDDA